MSERARLAAPLLASLCLVMAAARPAAAYVRYRTGGAGYYWRPSCVPVTLYVGKFTDMTAHEVAKSVAAAAHTWSPERITCPSSGGAGAATHPFLEIVPAMAPADAVDPRAPVNDARNSIVFRTENWAAGGDPNLPYDGLALALTTVTVRADAHIVDADMELNATHTFGTFANIDPDTPPPGNGQTVDLYDLQTTLTHEFGHFIGLNHSCDDGTSKEPPIDDKGNPAIDCGLADSDIVSTVMYPRASAGDTAKRVLSEDEIRAACDIYPAAKDPHSCALDVPNDGCGCSVGGARGGSATAAAFAASLLAAVRRRRRRRRHG